MIKFFSTFKLSLMFLFSLCVILCSKCIKLILNSLELGAYNLKMLILLCKYYSVKSSLFTEPPRHFPVRQQSAPNTGSRSAYWLVLVVPTGRPACSFSNPNVASCLSREETVLKEEDCYRNM